MCHSLLGLNFPTTPRKEAAKQHFFICTPEYQMPQFLSLHFWVVFISLHATVYWLMLVGNFQLKLVHEALYKLMLSKKRSH